jgi:hypothetical protein
MADPTPADPSPDELLNRHLDRTGARDAARQDPMAALQVAILRDFLHVLRAALADEHVDPDTAHRVIERVIYGCVPQPAVVKQMLAERRRHVEDLARTPTRWTLAEGSGGRSG